MLSGESGPRENEAAISRSCQLTSREQSCCTGQDQKAAGSAVNQQNTHRDRHTGTGITNSDYSEATNLQSWSN